jgi:hypothetical protein
MAPHTVDTLLLPWGSSPQGHLRATSLAAPTRTPATPASIARTVPRHDAAAEAAGGSVAQVDDAGQRVGGVNRAGSRFPATTLRTPDGGRRFF